jgi:hypothetical protein
MYLNDYTRHAQSADRSRRRMRYRGVTPNGHRLWTPKEDETCRKHGNDYRILQTKLPHRSYEALKQRCRLLGLCPQRQMVTAREVSLLRRLGAASVDELRAAFPTRTLSQLNHLRRYHGVPARRRQFSPTGFPIIDSVRSRCFELNYSMSDLDQLAKSNSYFQRAGWLRGNINYRAIGRAVAALDGDLTVRWRDE